MLTRSSQHVVKDKVLFGFCFCFFFFDTSFEKEVKNIYLEP